MAGESHFGPQLFEFLHQLEANNNRDWFQANKDRYERDVRDPMLRFISDLGPRLKAISPQIKVDPRPSGGSLFRIYRDVRFSKNKSPYKTHVAARFQHQRGKDVHSPGYYVHLGPGEVYCGAGIWHPDSKSLATIRRQIADRGREWRAILEDAGFGAAFTQGGESLKRGPKGFDPDHPMIDQLKRKDFVASFALEPADVVAPGFLERYAEACGTAEPYVGFLTRALGLEW